MEWIKAHPWLAGGGLLALFVVILIARSSGGGGGGDVLPAAQADNSAAVAAMSQYQQASLQASMQAAHDNANLEALEITASRDLNIAGLQADVTKYLGDLSHKSTDLASTLNAQVMIGQTNTELQKAGLAADVEKARIYSDANKQAWMLQTIQAISTGRTIF